MCMIRQQLGIASGALRYVIFIIGEYDAQPIVATPEAQPCTHPLPLYLSANSVKMFHVASSDSSCQCLDILKEIQVPEKY